MLTDAASLASQPIDTHEAANVKQQGRRESKEFQYRFNLSFFYLVIIVARMSQRCRVAITARPRRDHHYSEENAFHVSS
jgi:hypothetical protein